MAQKTQSVIQRISDSIGNVNIPADGSAFDRNTEQALLDIVKGILGQYQNIDPEQSKGRKKKPEGQTLLERPDAICYRKMLRFNKEERAAHMKGNSREALMFQAAYADLAEELGDFTGPGLQSGDFPSGTRAKEILRREALNLCLEVQPQASCDTIRTILSKHLGAVPLHMRNPMDAIYYFTFISRDDGHEDFATLEQQHAFIERMWKLVKDFHAAKAKKARQKPEKTGEETSLPSTESVENELAEVEPGDIEEFEEWLTENLDVLDKGDHHYTARIHFSDNLHHIAYAEEADRRAMGSARYISRDNPSVMNDGVVLRTFASKTYTSLRKDAYDHIKDLNQIESLDDFVKKLVRAIDRKSTHDDGEPASAPQILQGESYLNAAALMTNYIPMDIYDLWHAIGVDYLLEHEGNLPENFPEAGKWKEYYERLMWNAEAEENVLNVHMDEEPDYLSALRKYAALPNLPGDFKKHADRIRAVQETMEKYEDLMECSLFYALSDWHYACIADAKNGGRKAKGEEEQEEEQEAKSSENASSKSSANASAIASTRLERITSRTNKVFKGNRSDVADVPRSLLILSELVRLSTVPGTSFDYHKLTKHMNSVLETCGYAYLDARKMLDRLFLCSILMTEVFSGKESAFDLDIALDALHEFIRDQIFSTSLIQFLDQYYSAELPQDRDRRDDEQPVY